MISFKAVTVIGKRNIETSLELLIQNCRAKFLCLKSIIFIIELCLVQVNYGLLPAFVKQNLC